MSDNVTSRTEESRMEERLTVHSSRSRKGDVPSQSDSYRRSYLLTFDTANEVIAVGLGRLVPETMEVQLVATRELAAHRASNTRLIPTIDDLMSYAGVTHRDLAVVACGRGPGSFTGIRIALATAKGIASAFHVPLVGLSTLSVVARHVFDEGVRGNLVVIADAMRKEVYPAAFRLTQRDMERLGADRVVKADDFARELSGVDYLVGDALGKYLHLYEDKATVLPKSLWTPTGSGLLSEFQAQWRCGAIDPFDRWRFDPGVALPVYTRLSDAEEHERLRLASPDPRNLVTGVQTPVDFRPLSSSDVAEVSALESRLMGSDAWNEALVADELNRRDRSWWVASRGRELLGYAGGWVIDGELQILKVGISSEHRRRGIASQLLARVGEDARNLGATKASLEVRVGNIGAQRFYHSLGFHDLGRRPGYYSDREDALILVGPLPFAHHDVGGMALENHEHVGAASRDPREISAERPLILAIETSCDETAAAVVTGQGVLLSDVVASQVDFHARFGGVVPEIASRKHIEAISGVCDECFEVAAKRLEMPSLNWEDLDAVAVTYTPGLVGALVVGVAFAKGAAWAAEKPFIGVHHLEGHLYANKLGDERFAPPAVVSLVSGGNTMLVYMRDWGDYVTLGFTIDDAVGEAFDKVAKALGLGYPGGPVISRLAAQGDPNAIAFPRAMLHSGDLRFSLSGLKTAVITYIHEQERRGIPLNISDIAASFQQAVIDVQIAKAKTALEQTGAPTFCLGGGVAANGALRLAYERLCDDMGVRLVLPPLASCGDNAGMIALVALDRYNQGKFFDFTTDAYAHRPLDEPY